MKVLFLDEVENKCETRVMLFRPMVGDYVAWPRKPLPVVTKVTIGGMKDFEDYMPVRIGEAVDIIVYIN